MEEILIVPDVHGRKFWKEALNYDGRIIFLGDYTDPYPDENITQEDAYNNLLEIINFKKNNSDRVTLLIGNHELHYYDILFECSRFSFTFYDRYNALLTSEENKDLFQLCKQNENYLFIHAGILKEWYDKYYEQFSSLGNTLEKQLNTLFVSNKKPFGDVSFKYRWGYSACGSPIWADIREHLIEEPFNKDIIQIIGHTQLSSEEPLIKDNIRLLDNRKLYLLREGEIIQY